MKSTVYVIIAVFIMGFLFSCGPSAEEKRRQQEQEDSIAEQERESAIDKASKLLNTEEDSVIADTTVTDSL